MITRDDILSKAASDCMEELYSLAQPAIKWGDFIKENEEYSKKYTIWKQFNNAFHRKEEDSEEWESIRKQHPDWENKSITECIGPRPYEFYYLPREVMNEICDSYVHSYRIDAQQNLLDIINILKHYCKEPIKDKYIEGYTEENGFHHPGHRGYEHPDNLQKEVNKLLIGIDETNIAFEDLSNEITDKFFEFLDMAGDFFSWNRDLNVFNTSVYLGASPNSNKETVIENWKKYRGKDIEIDESKYKEDDEDDE